MVVTDLQTCEMSFFRIFCTQLPFPDIYSGDDVDYHRKNKVVVPLTVVLMKHIVVYAGLRRPSLFFQLVIFSRFVKGAALVFKSNTFLSDKCLNTIHNF